MFMDLDKDRKSTLSTLQIDKSTHSAPLNNDQIPLKKLHVTRMFRRVIFNRYP